MVKSINEKKIINKYQSTFSKHFYKMALELKIEAQKEILEELKEIALTLDDRDIIDNFILKKEVSFN